MDLKQCFIICTIDYILQYNEKLIINFQKKCFCLLNLT